MLEQIRSRLSYANVMATLAAFIALGLGTAWALDSNSVRSRHIVDGQVKKRDLGVPARYIEFGFEDEFGGCGDSVNQWVDATFFNEEAGYYRDPFGIVHLQGTVVRCGTVSDVIFTLPAGFRPEGPVDIGAVKNQTDAHSVRISENGDISATTPGILAGNQLSFEGISFRCSPSGENGCP